MDIIPNQNTMTLLAFSLAIIALAKDFILFVRYIKKSEDTLDLEYLSKKRIKKIMLPHGGTFMGWYIKKPFLGSMLHYVPQCLTMHGDRTLAIKNITDIKKRFCLESLAYS